MRIVGNHFTFPITGHKCSICTDVMFNTKMHVPVEREHHVVYQYTTEYFYRAIARALKDANGFTEFIAWPCTALAIGLRVDNLTSIFRDDGPALLRCEVHFAALRHSDDGLYGAVLPYGEYGAAIDTMEVTSEVDIAQVTGLVLLFIGAVIPKYVMSMPDPRGILALERDQKAGEFTMLHRCMFVPAISDRLHMFSGDNAVTVHRLEMRTCEGETHHLVDADSVCDDCIVTLQELGMHNALMTPHKSVR